MNSSRVTLLNTADRSRNPRDKCLRNGGTPPGGSNKVKLNIRTPIIRPDKDCPIQYFETNLMESITLLSGYQQLQERNKRFEEELKQGRQHTVNYLVGELIKRKQDHEVVGRCVEVLKSIKDEYEKVKKQIAEDAVKKMEALRVDQCVQSGVVCFHRSTQCEVGKMDRSAQHSVLLKDDGTEPHMEFREVIQAHVPKVTREIQTEQKAVGTDEKWTETEGFLVPTTSVKAPKGIRITAPPEMSGEPDDDRSHGNGTVKCKKRVRFQDDEPQSSGDLFSSSTNAPKRQVYNPRPVNMYQNIIPESILVRKRQSTAAVPTPGRPGGTCATPRGGKTAVSKKMPKFSGKHLSRDELERIYGSDILGDIITPRNNSSSEISSSKIQEGSSAQTTKAPPCDSSDDAYEPLEIPETPQRMMPSHRQPADLNSSLDDFTPFTPLNQRYAQSFNQPKDIQARFSKEGFHKMVSTLSCKRKKNFKTPVKEKSDGQAATKGSEKRLKSLKELLNDQESPADSFAEEKNDLDSSFQIDDPSPEEQAGEGGKDGNN